MVEKKLYSLKLYDVMRTASVLYGFVFEANVDAEFFRQGDTGVPYLKDISIGDMYIINNDGTKMLKLDQDYLTAHYSAICNEFEQLAVRKAQQKAEDALESKWEVEEYA